MQQLSGLMGSIASCLLVLLLILKISAVHGGEMTFELPDKEKMCFHEFVAQGTKCMIEFQVVQGGNYDVDMVLVSPRGGAILYSGQKKQYDRYEWTAEAEGEYRFCFSNEFSTFTHKIVYFDFQVGEQDDNRLGLTNPLTAMTQMETSVLALHQSLKVVVDYQTHHRIRESQGRSFAEDVNERVQYWSIGQTVIIVAASIAQVLILRSFFTDRKPHSLYNARS